MSIDLNRRGFRLGLTLLLAAATTAAADTTAATSFEVHGEGTDAVVAWSANAGEASVAACFLGGNGPQEARMYAMMHVAIHDALNGIDRRSRPYAVDLQAPRRTSPDAAVAAAAHDVLVPVFGSFSSSFGLPADCIDAGVASVEADYTAALDMIPDGNAKERGIALGQEAADSDTRSTGRRRLRHTADRPELPRGHRPRRVPLHARHAVRLLPVPGGGPHSLRAAGRFAVPAGTAVPTDQPSIRRRRQRGAEARRRRHRHPERPHPGPDRDRAVLGRELPTAVEPDRQDRLEAEGLDLWENARLFGLLNMALTDGYIGTFEAKYHYRFWRPVTAIQLADIDGNPATTADPTWTPLEPTPPIPDYDSGHAVEGGAAAQVLRRFFHTDKMSFSVCSFTLPEGQRCSDESPTLRHFTRFSQAMDENAASRIYVGFHFRDAVETGSRHGERIANWTVSHAMLPVH